MTAAVAAVAMRPQHKNAPNVLKRLFYNMAEGVGATELGNDGIVKGV